MSDVDAPSPEAIVADLRLRAEALEQQLTVVQRDAENRLIRAELKAEAVRAGILDLDGLKLVDTSGLKLNDMGDVEGAPQIIAQLRQAKPWLFGSASSSSIAAPPPSQPPRQKRATDMTEAEWRAARADILRRRF
jgi:hypothetical protein